MIESILAAHRDLRTGSEELTHKWVTPYEKPASEPPHQFVLFLKPEVTAVDAGVRLEGILEIIFETLARWDILVGGVRVLRGDYLSGHRIMDQHYGVINSISHGGRSAIAPAAEAKLVSEFGTLIENGAPVLGGHEFLEKFPQVSAFALAILNINLGTTKLAGGTYVMSVKVLGQPCLVLNPFHPYQLEPYCAPSNAIIVMECRAGQPWAELRSKLAGATDPLEADAGSLRQLFLKDKDALGLSDVSQSANGIHLSAGPLEGMVEIQRFFTDHDGDQPLSFIDTSFGQLLADQGLSAEQITALAGNPVIESHGTGTPAFDLTEEVDADQAYKLLI